ncbi:MAG TPA: GntR family transcriptional regulator [Segeticoccus sp.]|uniref:GntR family transcriptional regulator n=1 Tax=Segeticoccus sp. TaxID=2706531 RepID=UPI002D7F4BDB|nr:GntR family transcriptional regulator [Segeticoccus sp.]HET8601589.1 GntR family transcriptional regulator [Segeticoccus sp.]
MTAEWGSPDADRAAGTKHSWLRQQLRERIADLEPGSALPTERTLAAEFGVARMTVRNAIASLVREGLLRSEQGRGTFVQSPPLELRVRLGSFADAVRRAHLHPTTTTLCCVLDPDPPPPVRRHLRVRQGRAVARLERLRHGDDSVLAVERTWLPQRIAAGLLAGEEPVSLYGYLEERGALPDSGEESVSAGLPDDSESRHLKINPSVPVIRLTRRAYAGTRPVEYAEAVLPAHRYVLWFPLAPGGDGRLQADLSVE